MTVEEFMNQVEGDDFRERCTSMCGLLREIDSRYDWVGMYWLSKDKSQLTLGPWSGEQETEHKKIPVDQGICGAAVREGKTIIVNDVQSDPRYLACFVETKSEIVVPIRKSGKIIGEIDIDGKTAGAYTDADRIFLEGIAEEIAREWPGKW